MSKHKRDSISPFDNNFLTDRECEEIYLNIDYVKSKGKKRSIADERIENGGSHYGKRVKANRKITTDNRSLVYGITAADQKNKRCSDVNSDGDIVDENNSSFNSSQFHILGVARCTDGMSSQGTKTANNIAFVWTNLVDNN
uniref:Transposase n=1 Tax=Strongyloides venezuelensis TaxID=75913 RepID=A0A0K0FEF1_STRVS